MAANTAIEWCDHTWTLVVGCDAVSPACAKCYAALLAARLEAMGTEKYRGLATRVGNVGKWTGEVRFDATVLDLPLRTRKPARWFLTSMGDIAHDKVTDAQLDLTFDVMERAHWHTFLVLTKRISRLARFLLRRPLKNVVIGCTAENQLQADAHLPHMQAISERGWRTFVSYEPALAPVDWTGWEFLQQLISGGESGHGSRPSHPDWHRAARDFADQHAIPYVFKQWGDWTPGVNVVRMRGKVQTADLEEDGWHLYREDLSLDGGHIDDEPDLYRVGKREAGRLLDGRLHDELPSPSPDRTELADSPSAQRQTEQPAECECCGLPPSKHDHLHWCENQSFRVRAPSA
jgi:protein gp37